MIIKTPPKITNRKSILKYIEVDLWGWIKDLSISILKLDFYQNFQTFTLRDLMIPPNSQIAISNAFKRSYPGTIPSARIIIRQQGNAVITDGNLPWDENHVYLFNNSANTVVISVIFFR